MIQYQPSWLAIDHLRTLLAIAFNTASHETVIILSIHEKLPKAIFASIMLFNHFVWETASLFISDKDLFWLEACEFLNAFVDVSTDEVSIAAVHLGVGFFDEGYPHFMNIFAVAEDGLFVLDFDWNSFINDDVNPVEVLVDSEDIDASRSVTVEDRRIESITQYGRNLLVHYHFRIILHPSSASYQQLISHDNRTHSRYQPAITKTTLHTVSLTRTIINELCLVPNNNITDIFPFNITGFSVAFLWYFTCCV